MATNNCTHIVVSHGDVASINLCSPAVLPPSLLPLIVFRSLLQIIISGVLDGGRTLQGTCKFSSANVTFVGVFLKKSTEACLFTVVVVQVSLAQVGSNETLDPTLRSGSHRWFSPEKKAHECGQLQHWCLCSKILLFCSFQINHPKVKRIPAFLHLLYVPVLNITTEFLPWCLYITRYLNRSGQPMNKCLIYSSVNR
jgi:hypothetical protein